MTTTSKRDATVTLQPTEPGTLASTGDARRILDAPASSISRWAKNGSLPRPIDLTAAGPIWKVSDLEAFAASRRSRASNATH